MRLPASPSHSRRTGTREFMRIPRRLSPWRAPRGLASRVLTAIFASESHAKVEWKNGQWYGRVETHEWIAVRKDRSEHRDRQDLRNLIVNADDLGWTDGVNRGIADAHRNGIVTSASLLANGPAFQSGVELAHATPGLGVGVHLNLSDGEPVADRESVTTLLNDRGEFEGRPESLLLRLARRSVLLSEIEQEWDAQIQKIRD